MSQTYSCYVTKDINKKSNRKNWLGGTLEYSPENAKITVKNESGTCVAERFDDLVFNNFMNNDIIKVGSFEVELANISSNNSNNNNNNNQRYRSNNNYNSNSHNGFKQKPRKFKCVVPKFDNTIAKRRKIQNNYGSMKNNTFNRNGYNGNNSGKIINLSKSFDDVRMTNKTNNNHKNCHIGIKRFLSNENNDRNNNKNMSSETTNTENIIIGSILDYIDIETNALKYNNDEIYQNKQCQIFEDLMQSDYKSKNIPKQFCRPYFLPFYDTMPEIIHRNIDDNIIMNFGDGNKENHNVDNTVTE
eukprot:394581_1